MEKEGRKPILKQVILNNFKKQATSINIIRKRSRSRCGLKLNNKQMSCITLNQTINRQ